jgi:hypothetical protein
VHHYGADGHVCKTQRQVRHNLSLFSYVFRINLFVTLDSMLQTKSTGIKLHYLDVWLPVHEDGEARAEKLVSNNIKCYVIFVIYPYVLTQYYVGTIYTRVEENPRA